MSSCCCGGGNDVASAKHVGLDAFGGEALEQRQVLVRSGVECQVGATSSSTHLMAIVSRMSASMVLLLAK